MGTMYHSFPMLYKDLYSKSFFTNRRRYND
nr:MAG TPA: hypothetical protein [Caudoviricetes sp.]